MFHYRVGTYEAMAKLPDVEFELWHGSDIIGTKKKNYKGAVGFNHKQLSGIHLPFRTNNGSGKMPFYPFLFFKLIRYNPDVILSEGASNFLTMSVAFVYSRVFHKKMILWSMGALAGREYKGIRGLVQRWIRLIERKVDAVFTYSTQAENYFIKEGVKKERIFKAINVIDTNVKIASIKEEGTIEKESGFNVVFVGAINMTKRLELLVDSIEILSTKFDDVRLHIIGDGGYLPSIKDYVEKNGLRDKVVFHGRVTDGLNVLLSRYQVLALPGLGGLAIVDGMISSLPIISGMADGTEKDLIDDNNGFVTENMTVEYMVEKLTILHESATLMKQMGENSFRKITHEYSFDNYIEIFHNCLKYVTNEK